jgi:hypothetical protein
VESVCQNVQESEQRPAFEAQLPVEHTRLTGKQYFGAAFAPRWPVGLSSSTHRKTVWYA